MRPLFVSLWRTGENPRLFARFRSQRNEYHSYRKSENRTIFHVQKLIISYIDQFVVPEKLQWIWRDPCPPLSGQSQAIRGWPGSAVGPEQCLCFSWFLWWFPSCFCQVSVMFFIVFFYQVPIVFLSFLMFFLSCYYRLSRFLILSSFLTPVFMVCAINVFILPHPTLLDRHHPPTETTWGFSIKNTKNYVSNKSNRVHLGVVSDWWICSMWIVTNTCYLYKTPLNSHQTATKKKKAQSPPAPPPTAHHPPPTTTP